MKKWQLILLAIALCGCLVIGMSACADDVEEAPDTDPGESQSQDAGNDESEGDNNQGDNNQGDNNQGDNNQGDDNQGDNNQGDDNQGDDNQGGGQESDSNKDNVTNEGANLEEGWGEVKPVPKA